MKQLYLSMLCFLIFISSEAQIITFWGIHDVDSCRFETPCGLTQLYSGPDNIWQRGRPQKPFFDSAYSLPYAMVTDTINPYRNSVDSYFDLILPVWQYYYFGIIVGFKHKFQTDTLVDGGYIEDSYDKGQTWVNVLDDQFVHNVPIFASENLYTTQNSLQGGHYGFSGNSGGWIYTRIQWVWTFPVKDSPPDTLMLRFHFISDSIQTNKDGWMIDNLLISYADEGSGIDETAEPKVKIDILPNPAEDFTTVEFNPSMQNPVTMILTNSLGNTVRKEENIFGNKMELSRDGLNSGVYFAQFYSGKSFLGVKKVVFR
jgi:hypothetical protein